MSAGNVTGLFTVRNPAWHDLTATYDHDRYPETVAEARQWAGLDWDPIRRDVYSREVIGGEPFYSPIPSASELVRSDNGGHLSVVSDTYTPVSNGTLFEVAEALTGLAGVKFETAGELDGGAKVWALAYLDEPWTVPGDGTQVYPYIAVMNGHDGATAFSATLTDIRVVCQNTFNYAEMTGDRQKTRYVFKHTARVMDRISEAKAAITGLRTEAAKTQELALELSRTPVDAAQAERFVVELFPMPHEAAISPRVKTNVETARTAVRQLLAPGSETTTGINTTAYGLFQAGVEYLDHYRSTKGNRSERIFGRTLLTREPQKARVFSLVKSITGS